MSPYPVRGRRPHHRGVHRPDPPNNAPTAGCGACRRLSWASSPGVSRTAQRWYAYAW